jgi:hypothetical protein
MTFVSRFARLAACALLVASVASCASTRTSTTPRTAIEMALISQSAENTLEKFETDALTGKSFAMDDTHFEATDKAFAQSALRLQMLKNGMNETKAEEAEVSVRPRVAIAAIDDFNFFIGIPSIPLILPGVGAAPTPELAFFKRAKQIGRNRMGAYAVNKDGSLAHDFGVQATEVYYTHWTILALINFRRTNLEEPYNVPADSE